jgi:hypothetical protein
MPITYRIDRQRGIVWTHVTGVLTDAVLLAHKRRLVNDPDFQPGMRELSDVRAIERLEVTPKGISRFVAQDKTDASHLGDHRLAIVASENVVYGMARIYQALSDDSPSNVMVFRNPAEAKTWLEIDE